MGTPAANILAIETSTMTAGVALLTGAGITERQSGVNTHSEEILVLVQELLQDAGITARQLDTVAVGAGPGSFTGLRIGMATAKGLCVATGASLVAVSSLAILARGIADAGAGTDDLLVPVMDARRGEIFVGFYRRDGQAVAAVAAERVMAPTDLAAAVAEHRSGAATVMLAGDGLSRCRSQAEAAGVIARGAPATPSAVTLARLAALAPEPAQLAAVAPTYIRPSEAEIRFPDGNPGGTFSGKL